jgi:hypothetical protein
MQNAWPSSNFMTPDEVAEYLRMKRLLECVVRTPAACASSAQVA